MSGKIVSIQILRAIACLSVLYLHVIGRIPLTSININGGIGVDIFFVISGFIIAASLQKLPEKKKGLVFLINRFTRVAPYYTLMTLAIVLLHPGKYSILHIVRSILYIPQINDPVIILGWTLNHEILFYSFIGVSLMVFPRIQAIYLGLLFGLFILLCSFLPQEHYIFAFLSSNVNYTFLLGFFAYCFKDRLIPYFKQKWMVAFSVLLLFILSICTSDGPVTTFQQAVYSPFAYRRCNIFFYGWIEGYSSKIAEYFPRVIILGFPSFLLFVTFLAHEYKLKQYINSWVVKIGDASYTLYLFQFLALTSIPFRLVGIMEFLVFVAIIIASVQLLKIENRVASASKNLLYDIVRS